MCVTDTDPIRYSKYVDDCCRVISEEAEYPTDIYAVHLTRLHGLANRISGTLLHDDWDMTSSFTSAPIGACVQSLKSELLQLGNKLLVGAHQNRKCKFTIRFVLTTDRISHRSHALSRH